MYDSVPTPRPSPSVSVVVPVYNGSLHLEELCARIRDSLAVVGARYEIILVNDASTDESWETIRCLSKWMDGVRGIDLEMNVGQHAALLLGMWSAVHEVIVTLDDDLQHPPEEIPRLLKELAIHPAAVVYCRHFRPPHALWRIAASWLVNWALRFSAGPVPPIGPYRAFRSELIERIPAVRGRVLPIDVYLARQEVVPLVVQACEPAWRPSPSRYSVRRLGSLALDLTVGFIPVKALAACVVALMGMHAQRNHLAAARGIGQVPVAAFALLLSSRWVSFRFGHPVEGALRSRVREVVP